MSPLSIPIGLNVSVSRSGARLTSVECEGCRQAYHYLKFREVTSTESSPLFLDNQGAERRAEETSAEWLRESLEKVDAVPCPACGRYQASMVAPFRAEQFTWTQRGLLVTGLVCIVSGFLLVGTFTAGFKIDQGLLTWIFAVSGGLLAVGLFTLSTLRSRIDPNQNPQANREAARWQAIGDQELQQVGARRLALLKLATVDIENRSIAYTVYFVGAIVVAAIAAPFLILWRHELGALIMAGVMGAMSVGFFGYACWQCGRARQITRWRDELADAGLDELDEFDVIRSDG